MKEFKLSLIPIFGFFYYYEKTKTDFKNSFENSLLSSFLFVTIHTLSLIEIGSLIIKTLWEV